MKKRTAYFMKQLSVRLTMFLVIFILCCKVEAQKSIEKTFELQGKQKVEMSFKWPKLIKIYNWDGANIKVKGSVLINNGNHDDSFQLRSKLESDRLDITSNILNIDDIPKRILIKKDGMSYYFNTDNWNDPEVQKFMNEEGGRNNSYVTSGVIKEIELEIFVPKGVEVIVNAKYGLVEINEIENQIMVDAKYGGIDMAFGSFKKQLEAKTRYGEIYSNLPFELESNRKDFNHDSKWTIVTYGKDSKNATLESKYGNVFLRQKRGS